MTQKEKKREYDKKYREDNKERIAAYYEANKEKRKEKRDSKKDGLYTVYYLKEDHYVGLTNCLYKRLEYHKNTNKRHVEDVEIIGKYQNKEEGLRVEAALHAMGYLGRHPKSKQQTLKQLL